MQPLDPTERFNGVTEIHFAVNEDEPQSEFQTARVPVKIPGWKEVEICLLILKVLLYVGAPERLCLISVAAEWDGLPLWHSPPLSFKPYT